MVFPRAIFGSPHYNTYTTPTQNRYTYSFRPPDIGMSEGFNLALPLNFFDIRPLFSQTAQRRPVKSISKFGPSVNS